MKLLKQAHTVYKTQYHIVWVTRYRRKILKDGIEEYLKKLLLDTEKHFPDIKSKEVGTDEDHLHARIVIPPKYSVSKIVSALKSNSSRKLKKKFPYLKKVYWDGGGIWSTGFFVSTVGINEEIIQKYIEMQGQHDAGQAELVL